MLRNITVPLNIAWKRDFGNTTIFKRHEELGRGGFAGVYKVTNTETGEVFAIKAVPKVRVEKPKSLEKLKCEIEIQRSLNHPNVLKSYGNFEDFYNYYIVLEFAPGGSVKDLVRSNTRLSESETARILREVMSGLCYIHDNKIIHRDLKLENFLIGKDGRVKIADFGLSTRIDYDDEKKYTLCGTPNYISPEQLTHSNKGHSYEVDIWAIGVCAFTMLTGKPPFETPRRKLTYEHIKNCTYSFPPDIPLSHQAKNFIKKILQIKPERRPNAQDVALHPFLTQITRAPSLPAPVTAKIAETPAPKYPMRTPAVTPIAPIPPMNPVTPMTPLTPLAPMTPIAPMTTNANLKTNLNLNPNANVQQDPIRQPLHKIQDLVPDQLVYMPRQCVSRFCDHSDKYGLGYMLIDGTIGACFNDYSRMVMDPHEQFVQYWESSQTLVPEVMDPHSGPQTKKLALIRRFSESLKKTKSMYELPAHRYSSAIPMKHVKYWIRNDEAALFRLDDKNIQVNFNDRTKLVIFWNSRKILIVHSIKQAGKLIPISQVCAMSSNTDERKRYRVAKTMLAALSH
ncbi:hypothetical protein M9Y10_045107 [Tritrichomonas musculus]|uniref:Serine/threonine-protein kinase PLK n=1 Tax=Tritrichomonas musculus TaxID=1915356 RepID=A0ABR2JUB6_9EUKA